MSLWKASQHNSQSNPAKPFVQTGKNGKRSVLGAVDGLNETLGFNEGDSNGCMILGSDDGFCDWAGFNEAKSEGRELGSLDGRFDAVGWNDGSIVKTDDGDDDGADSELKRQFFTPSSIKYEVDPVPLYTKGSHA